MLNHSQIRKNILLALAEAQTGHLGGSLGSLEMQALLAEQVEYDTKWYTKAKHLDKPHTLQLATKLRAKRNKFILSAGHLAPALYAVWAELGLYDDLIESEEIEGVNSVDKRTEYLKGIRDLKSDLEGHPSLVHNPFLVDASTGPLGQGAGVSVGYGLHDLRAVKDPATALKTFALLGDGECQEGQIWESAMIASKYHLENLTWVVDRNFVQIDGDTEEVGGLDHTHGLPEELSGLGAKFAAFGWIVEENLQGNDHAECLKYLRRIQEKQTKHHLPGVILNYTQLGHPFKEFATYHWHGKTPSYQEALKAINYLDT